MLLFYYTLFAWGLIDFILSVDFPRFYDCLSVCLRLSRRLRMRRVAVEMCARQYLKQLINILRNINVFFMWRHSASDIARWQLSAVRQLHENMLLNMQQHEHTPWTYKKWLHGYTWGLLWVCGYVCVWRRAKYAFCVLTYIYPRRAVAPT